MGNGELGIVPFLTAPDDRCPPRPFVQGIPSPLPMRLRMFCTGRQVNQLASVNGAVDTSIYSEDRIRAIDATADFARRYGHEPVGVWAAPGRINLIGEHTDYNDGFVLPLALPHTTVIAAGIRLDDMLVLRSADYDHAVVCRLTDLAPGSVRGWAAYPAGVAWALREAGYPIAGVDLYIDSEIPRGAGLSSSAALECATALALLATIGITPGGRGPSRREIAQLSQRAENTFVGVSCGVMDHAASLLGVADHALLLDCRTLNAQLIPVAFAEHGVTILIIDTRTARDPADGEQAARRASCDDAAQRLGVTALRDLEPSELSTTLATFDELTARRVRHVVTENHRVGQVADLLLDGGRNGPTAIGALLNQSHASLRDDFEVSCPELDLAVNTAYAAGALGARMTGGGFGGSALALVPDEHLNSVCAAIPRAFSNSGFTTPDMYVARPSAGARRIG